MEEFVFKLRNAVLGGLFLLSGCFSLIETPLPKIVMTAPPASGRTVSLRGFDATVSEYVTVTGVQTVYIDPWYDGWWGGPGCVATVPVSATMVRPRATDFFRDRARNLFEESGWAVMAQVPDYLVEVKFTGPTEPANAGWWRTLRVVGTLFFSDRAIRSWQANLRIYDNRTGKLLTARTFEETDDESMWSLVPVFGPIIYDRTEYDRQRLQCLAALTDRAAADASAFLAGLK